MRISDEWKAARRQSGLARFERECGCDYENGRRVKTYRISGTSENGEKAMLLRETNRIYQKLTA